MLLLNLVSSVHLLEFLVHYSILTQTRAHVSTNISLEQQVLNIFAFLQYTRTSPL